MGYSALTFALLLPPAAAHSWHHSRVLDRWVPTSTNGGLNFYLNFADSRSLNFKEGDYTHKIMPIPNRNRYEVDELTDRPFYDNRYFYGKGFDLILDEPSRLFRMIWSVNEGLGLGWQAYWPGWTPWRYVLPVESRLFSFLFVVTGLGWLVVAFKRGLPFREEGAGWLWIAALILCSVITAAVFLGDPRIRVPYDPFFAIAASAAYVALAQRFRARRKGQPSTA